MILRKRKEKGETWSGCSYLSLLDSERFSWHPELVGDLISRGEQGGDALILSLLDSERSPWRLLIGRWRSIFGILGWLSGPSSSIILVVIFFCILELAWGQLLGLILVGIFFCILDLAWVQLLGLGAFFVRNL